MPLQIETKLALYEIGRGGARHAREFIRQLPPEERNEFGAGTYYFTLGYLLRAFGGIENLIGKHIIEVAGGTLHGSRAFRAEISRILSAQGVRMTLVDREAREDDFPKRETLRVYGEEVQKYMERLGHERADALISGAFFGGPEWDDLQAGNPSYTTELISAMSELSPIQIHTVQIEEFPLAAVPTADECKKLGLPIVYSMDYSRLHPTEEGKNPDPDFIVVDSREENKEG